jgi:Bacterial PH domain
VVSDSGEASRPEDVRFLLAPPAPVRSLGISAVAAVLAAAAIVLGSALQLPQIVAIVGWGLLIFAVVLIVVALVLTLRLRTTLIVDPQSITIIRGRRRRAVPWSMIDRVRMQGPRLLLITTPEGGPDAVVINPCGSTDATFTALIAEIQSRLNADRGYRPIS